MLNNLNHDKHISTITSNINHRLFNIKKITKHTTIQSRKILVKSIVIGKLNYGLPLLCNARQNQLSHLNTLITRSCRTIMGSRCPRWSNARLLNYCETQTIYQCINQQALNYIHSIQSNKLPDTLKALPKHRFNKLKKRKKRKKAKKEKGK